MIFIVADKKCDCGINYHVLFTFVMNEYMKLYVSESLLWKQKMYNSGTNNVFFVVLQFLVICGSCHVT